MKSPYYIASVVLLKLHGCVVSHMEVLATILLSVHNIKILIMLDPSLQKI